MTISRRLTLGFLTMIVIIIILGGTGLGYLAWMQSWRSDFTTSSTLVSASAQMDQLLARFEQSIQAPSMIGLVAKSLESAKSGVQSDVQKSKTLIASMAGSKNVSSTDQATLDKLKTSVDQFSVAELNLLDAAAANNTKAVSQYTQEATTAEKQVSGLTASIKQSSQAGNTGLMNTFSRVTTWLMIVMSVVVALGIAVAIALGLLISKSITGSLRETINSLSGSAAQLLAVSSQVAAGSAQTAASTNETTVTVEEVKQTALLAHEKAAEVAATSENVARVAEFGKGSVDATITGIERMQSEMDVVAQTINRLSDQTQAVGDIIATVNDLAEQSNLLSVNASIEAAKAGDHGKGFTVVAQEVKNLAEQSKQAVAQIRNILNEIQKASQTAVQAVEQGRDAVEAGRQQSLESGKAIQQLAETASEAAQSALQISASSRQQLAGMEQISQAIENINEAGGQSASGTRQVESEIKRLQGLAVTLKLQLEADPSN
jgi:chromosome segregation ATPase